MKIIAWNVNHRTIEKPISNDALLFFRKYCPDQIILNEYVDGESREVFKRKLMDIGYSHQLLSPKVGKQNQIFMASKEEIIHGDLPAPTITEPAKTNFLHAIVPRLGIEVVGIRAPAYKLTSERNAYWNQMSEIISSASGRNILFVGDINYNPFSGVAKSVPEIKFDLGGSFTIPNPVGDWSFISIDGKNSTRIDHAIVSKGVSVSDVRYLTVFDGIKLAGCKNDSAITDHAVLSLQVEARKSNY